MKCVCRTCHKEFLVEPPVVDGQVLLCPSCGAENVYRAPARIALPGNLPPAAERVAQPLTRSSDRVAAEEASNSSGREQKVASTMQQVSRFHVIRPAATAASSAAPEENALVGRVRARARTESRREVLRKTRIVFKKLCVVLGVLAALYLIVATAVCLFMPRMIAKAEARNFSIRVARVKLTQDLRIAEERIRTVKAETRENGLSRIAEVALLLDDADLNRLARTYLGEVWDERENAFLKTVTQSRRRLLRQRQQADQNRQEREKKIQTLEMRKKMLSRALHSPYCDQDRRKRISEIEQLLDEVCEEGAGPSQNGTEDLPAAEWVQNEKDLVAMAMRQEAETCEVLVRCMSERLERLRWMEARPARLRRIASAFGIGPFSKFFVTPQGADHAE